MSSKLAEIKKQNSKFLKSMLNAFNGLIYSFKTQPHLKIQSAMGILSIIAGVIFKLNQIEWIILVFTIMFVLFAEVVNTSIETVVDMYTEEYNEKAKIAKDVGAGAVVITSINALIVAVFLFII